MITLRAVNRAIRAAGYDAELVRGRGYFYFIGPAVERATHTGVVVFRLNQLDAAGWVRALREDVLSSIPPEPDEPRCWSIIRDP